jgi:hypothetical protein
MPSTIVMTDEGCEDILEYYLANKQTHYKLFSNNYSPLVSSVIGDFTEVTGGDYAQKTLTAGSWTTEENDPRDCIYAEQTYTFTGVIGGSGSVYGWVLTDDTEALVIAAGLLTAPFTPSASGGVLKITPKIQTSNGTPT